VGSDPAPFYRFLDAIREEGEVAGTQAFVERELEDFLGTIEPDDCGPILFEWLDR